MRDYTRIDKYLTELYKDIYPQVVDPGHALQTKLIFNIWISALKVKTAIDIGCGQGIAFPFFKQYKIGFVALTLGGKDYDYLLENYPNEQISKSDMHFIDFEDKQFDLIYARHILEHSPMPLLALMEWHRIAKKYAVIILPNPDMVVSGGINHYYLLNVIQWKVLFKRAKWEVLREDHSDMWEYRFLLQKI